MGNFTLCCLFLVFSFVPVGLFALNFGGMDARLEQRSVLKFLCKSGHTPIQCWRQMQDVFGAETMSKNHVRVWHRKFRGGDNNIKNLPKSGRPKSASSAAKVQAVDQFIQRKRNATLQEVANEVDISVTSAHRIMKKELKLSKLCPKFVPKDLTQEQQNMRKRICQANIDLLRDDNMLLHKVVTGDESWVSVYEMETKQKSSQWLPHGSTLQRPLKPLKQRSEKKSMLTVFFDRDGVILAEFAPPSEKVTAETYCETLRLLKERLRRKRPHLWVRANRTEQRPFLLHHDNASSHTAVPTLAFIGESDIDMLAHPPYSPDLVPCDYFLFPRLKNIFRGVRHASKAAMERAIKDGLRQIPPEDFVAAIDSMPVRWMKCVAANGQYFEGKHIAIDPENDHGLAFEEPDTEEESEEEN